MVNSRTVMPGTPGAFFGTPCAFRGTPCAFRGTPCAFRGTPGAFRGTPGAFSVMRPVYPEPPAWSRCGVAVAHEVVPSRKACGVDPVLSLKNRMKWEGVQKPTADATSETLAEPPRSRTLA